MKFLPLILIFEWIASRHGGSRELQWSDRRSYRPSVDNLAWAISSYWRVELDSVATGVLYMLDWRLA